MKIIRSFRKNPERSKDLEFLENALNTLETYETNHGAQYIYEHIQHPALGGTYRLNRADQADMDLGETNRLGIYDKDFFKRKITELSKEYT